MTPRFTPAILLLSGILLLAGCAAQRNATPEMMRHEVRTMYDGMSDVALYDNLRTWVLKNCQWNGDILQHEDSEARELMARGYWPRATSYAPMLEADIEYTLSMTVEAGEVYFQLSRLVARASSDGEEMTFFSTSEQFHVDAEERFQAMLASIDSSLSAKHTGG